MKFLLILLLVLCGVFAQDEDVRAPHIIVKQVDTLDELIDLSKVKTLLFESKKLTSQNTPQLVCTSGCRLRVSSILCENLDYGTETPFPNWKCTLAKSTSELTMAKVQCEMHANYAVKGSCWLEYKLYEESWAHFFLYWGLVFIIFCCCGGGIIVGGDRHSSGSSFAFSSTN